jgi:DNA-directed RNA polymerase specialized sigma24 family protein
MREARTTITATGTKREGISTSHVYSYRCERSRVSKRHSLRYLDAAYNLSRWLVIRDQDAADIVQEAYACALQGFSEFDGDNPRAWLLTIVRNTAHR